MKFLFLFCTHMMIKKPKSRLDNIKETMEQKLRYVLDYAVKHDYTLINTGDFTDIPRSWQILPWIQNIFREYNKKPLMLGVYGQHDTYMRSETAKKSTILGVLESGGFVQVLNKKPKKFPTGNNKMIRVYGCSYGSDIPEPAFTPDRAINILVIHKMIAPKKLWADQKDFEYGLKFLKKYSKYTVIACGDYHYKMYYRLDNRYIVNAGAMIRKTGDIKDITHTPGFFTYDTISQSMRWHIIPHKKASEVITREHLENDAEVDLLVEKFIQSVGNKLFSKTKALKHITTFKDKLEWIIKQNRIRKNVRDIIVKEIDEAKEVVNE